MKIRLCLGTQLSMHQGKKSPSQKLKRISDTVATFWNLKFVLYAVSKGADPTFSLSMLTQAVIGTQRKLTKMWCRNLTRFRSYQYLMQREVIFLSWWNAANLLGWKREFCVYKIYSIFVRVAVKLLFKSCWCSLHRLYIVSETFLSFQMQLILKNIAVLRKMTVLLHLFKFQSLMQFKHVKHAVIL